MPSLAKSAAAATAGALLSLACHSATPSPACPQFFLNQKTPSISIKTETKPLCFDAFAMVYNRATKTPVYVAEVLTRQSLSEAQDEKRTDRFYEEARLPTAWRAKLSDYQASGFDRGHMAPAADMPDATAMAQSFSLANMVPQNPHHNRKLWAGVEKATRKYAMRTPQPVYVITGPAYQCKGSCPSVGDGVAIPSHLFKLVQTPDGKSHAYWSENSESARVDIISKQELSERTGITFP